VGVERLEDVPAQTQTGGGGAQRVRRCSTNRHEAGLSWKAAVAVVTCSSTAPPCRASLLSCGCCLGGSTGQQGQGVGSKQVQTGDGACKPHSSSQERA
jgi:hypothetical protein